RLTVDWMVRLARALSCDPRDLMPEAGLGGALERSAANEDRPFADSQHLIPVRGAARGGDRQEMFLADGPIDHVPRPYYLAHVRDAYAIYVVGTSMVPMYRPRQLLFVNPYKPPAPGNGVVIIDHRGAVLIKEFVRQKPTGVVVREYQPALRDFTVAQDDVATMHAVVGAAEPQ
ncbi:MAG: helix-turn-helix transcriptional regulator, partial [Alphaproteobacteria bacterium]|nr:helix-turn-helix transcriptional regulator [Alphaproteobacteria bacterium]